MATEVKSLEDLERWLDGRPTANSAVIASRAALRVLPLISGGPSREWSTLALFTSTIFRATSLARVAANYPTHGNVLFRGDPDFAHVHAFAHAAGCAAADAAFAARAAAFFAADAAVAADAAIDADADFDDADDPVAARAASYAAYDRRRGGLEAAFAAAGAAARAAYAAAEAEEQFWQSVNADALALAEGLAPDVLSNRPLWPGAIGIPHFIDVAWRKLVQSLPPNEDWDVWTAWYNRRLHGRIDPESCELVFARVPEEEWKKGPAAVNAWIKAELAKLEPPAIPAQGIGPHVEIDIETGLVVPARPPSLDIAGNHLGRLQALRPQLRQLSQDLRYSLGRSNEHRELLDAISRYDDLIEKPLEEIDFDRLWGEGIFLEEAAAAAERRIEDVLSEPLNDERETMLKALLKVHGPFILASLAGQENLAAANAYELRPDEVREQQVAARELAVAFKAHPEVIAPETAQIFGDAVAQPESSTHPERSAVYRAGFGQNILIVIGGGAAIAGLGYVAGAAIGTTGAVVTGLLLSEALKKSDPFLAVSGLLTRVINEVAKKDYEALAKKLRHIRFDDYRKFMLEHEDVLRRFAGTRKQNRWLHEHLDWLKRLGNEG